MIVILILSQQVAASAAHVNSWCLKLMSMYRGPKGTSCCLLTSNRKRKLSSLRDRRVSISKHTSVPANVCELELQFIHQELWTEAVSVVWEGLGHDVYMCRPLNCVWRFIAKGTFELQIAAAAALELIQQLFNQETYRHCYATKPPEVPVKSCDLT